MVCQWGMSDLGPLTFGERDDLIFLGRDLAVNKNFSEKTSEMIDEEVKKIITRNFERAQQLLETHKAKLKKIAKFLLDKEVMTSDEINAIVKIKKAKAPRDKAEPKTTEDAKPLPPLERPEPAKA
jgi:cell division protease FtsH